MTQETAQRLQRVLDEQGYIVTWHDGPGRAIGEVITEWYDSYEHGRIQGALVVIETATFEDFAAQCRKYECVEPAKGMHAQHLFYKVVAE